MATRSGPRPVAGRSGFSLIELMIGLAIAALLSLVAVPFTMAWMDSNRQMQARNYVVDAVGRAKALALRNGSGRAGNAPVARIRLSGDLLGVENAASGDVLWSATLPRGVQLMLSDGLTPFNCTALNNRGLPVVPGGCDQAASRLVVKIADQENLDVELL